MLVTGGGDGLVTDIRFQIFGCSNVHSFGKVRMFGCANVVIAVFAEHERKMFGVLVASITVNSVSR